MPKLEMRDKQGTLTREGMIALIKEGQGVVFKGVVITRVEDVPSAADLAAGNPSQVEQVTLDLQAQMKSLQEQLNKLQSGAGKPEAPPAEAPTEAPAETPKKA